jgi:alpha-beta hydrolase superfamily lysophospholipase
MQQKVKRKIRNGLFLLLGLYLAGGMLLYFGQDLFLFHPVPLGKGHQFSFTQPYAEENLQVSGNNLNYVKFRPGGTPKGIVLFYHGNMRNVEHYKTYPTFFTRNGYEVWMIDYPGYGKTTGERTEARIYADALTLYDKARVLYRPQEIVLYGKSLGTGVASHVASLRPGKKLILETPYYSFPELARHYAPIYPVTWLSRYRFPVHSHIQKAALPLLLIHGTRDEIIPYEQAQRLAKEKMGARLVTIKDGRHNDLSAYPLFQQELDAALQH